MFVGNSIQLALRRTLETIINKLHIIVKRKDIKKKNGAKYGKDC